MTGSRCSTILHKGEGMNSDLVDKFNSSLLNWAKSAFLEEVRSGFYKAQSLNGLCSRQRVGILREQSAENLQILARVLPLGVWSESPGVDAIRNGLSDDEWKAVESLEAAAVKVYREHWRAGYEHLARQNTAEFREQFRKASKSCIPIVKGIAAKWKCFFTGAGPGEWGLIGERPWGRITVSLTLKRYLDVGYSISICDQQFNSIVFHSAYLGVLGIGGSEWANENAQQVPETLIKAGEFIQWHVGEYEYLIEAIL